MKEYFESEMRLLQDAAQEFADAYPEQAAMLNLKAVKDRDPYVERLLEGMAFLTAQVRERIDDGVPELSENLLDQLNPALCRPYPSYTLVRFDPEQQTSQTVPLKRGTPVRALNVGPDNVVCEYTTTSEASIQPILIDDVSVVEQIGGGTRIQIHIRKRSSFDWSDLDFYELPLHLHCDRALAYALYEAATDSRARLTMSLDNRTLPGEHRMMPAMLEPEASFLPNGGRGHVAFSLLHDYFNAREKYLFVKAQGFDSREWPADGRLLTLTLETPVTLPAGHHVRRETFQLNTVPAVNLFKTQAEPVRLTGKVPDYPLKVDHRFLDCANVYSVLEVSGRNTESGETRQFRPLHELSYRRAEDATYATHTRASGAGRRRTYISVTGVPTQATEVLSVDVLATNESYPRQYLELGGIDQLTSESSKDVSVTNIARPSKMVYPPSMQDFQWQLISLMSLQLSSLCDSDSFRTLLSLFDWSDQVENQNRIRAIESIQSDIKHRIRRGVLVQGLQITLEVKESGFSSRSDLYMFGTLLHQFFTTFANVTEYVETKLISLPTYKEWVWKPTRGHRPVL